MFDEAPFPALINALHYSFAQYQLYQVRFDLLYAYILTDLTQLATGMTGNVAARDVIIRHCLRLHIPPIMLKAIFQIDDPALDAITSAATPQDQPPLRFWKIISNITEAQATAVQLAGAAEAVMLAIYELAGATLHDAMRRDAMIAYCYAHGIALPLIADACGESLATIALTLQQHGFFA